MQAGMVWLLSVHQIEHTVQQRHKASGIKTKIFEHHLDMHLRVSDMGYGQRVWYLCM